MLQEGLSDNPRGAAAVLTYSTTKSFIPCNIHCSYPFLLFSTLFWSLSSATLIIPVFCMALDLESTGGLPDGALPSNARFPAADLLHSPYIDTNLSLHGQLYNRNMSPLADPMQNLNGCLTSNSSVSVLRLIYAAKNECFRACYPRIMPICLWSSYLVAPPRSN